MQNVDNQLDKQKEELDGLNAEAGAKARENEEISEDFKQMHQDITIRKINRQMLQWKQKNLNEAKGYWDNFQKGHWRQSAAKEDLIKIFEEEKQKTQVITEVINSLMQDLPQYHEILLSLSQWSQMENE